MSTITVIGITVVRGCGSDHVMLHTTLPDGCWPFSGLSTLDMSVAKGSAEKYIENHFPDITPKIIDTNVKGIPYVTLQKDGSRTEN